MKRVLTADELVTAVTSWAESQGDIVAVALVGSHARGNAHPDSDVDFVIVCAGPAHYLQELSWISEFGVAQTVSFEDWGMVQSVRAVHANGPEAEYGITSSKWMAVPLDKGTIRVLKHGVVVLLDRDSGLTHAVEWARQHG